MTREEYEFCSKELISCQKEEKLAIQRVKTAEINLKKAKAELTESKENLTGLRGMISTFIFEIRRYEKDNNEKTN
jgi:hypothetical protein